VSFKTSAQVCTLPSLSKHVGLIEDGWDGKGQTGSSLEGSLQNAYVHVSSRRITRCSRGYSRGSTTKRYRQPVTCISVVSPSSSLPPPPLLSSPLFLLSPFHPTLFSSLRLSFCLVYLSTFTLIPLLSSPLKNRLIVSSFPCTLPQSLTNTKEKVVCRQPHLPHLPSLSSTFRSFFRPAISCSFPISLGAQSKAQRPSSPPPPHPK
jgi:hypothetical protein